MKRFLQRILQEIMKKIILGTSDAWSMSRSSHQPSDPAYYIEDCRIYSKEKNLLSKSCLSWNWIAKDLQKWYLIKKFPTTVFIHTLRSDVVCRDILSCVYKWYDGMIAY